MLRFIYPCPDLYMHAQIYISVLRFIYPCSDLYIHAQIYISMLRFIYTCSDLFIHLQIYISMLRFIYSCPHAYLYIYIYEKIALLYTFHLFIQLPSETSHRFKVLYDCYCIALKYVAILQHPACSELIWLLPCCAHVCIGMHAGGYINVDSLSGRI